MLVKKRIVGINPSLLINRHSFGAKAVDRGASSSGDPLTPPTPKLGK